MTIRSTYHSRPSSGIEEAEDFTNDTHLEVSDNESDPTLNEEEYAFFETAMLPHLRSLYHFAYRLVGNADDANDLVQETYLKAFRFFHSFQKGSNEKAWLFRILKNSFINQYRKVTREPGKIDYEEAELFLNTGRARYAESIDARDKLFENALGDEISGALSALPDEFRMIVVLCDIENFSYEEIARITDVPIGTVRSRLHRARKMMKDKLIPYAISMGYLSK
ncbi:MAG: sigma-70 family RNA polymerase sigma factor [Bacteroidia bacterium]|nr:sigma-70 family RNA polymerase sigma factor [Bacteroidia bacterium]